ncbi:MAG: dihydrofolate reductase [Desulfatitalea sp.]|nr:dihydrofolate reductase [Desulfatitalea sp.]MBI5895455.1 dihydrofolate reductase [Desulfobacterales bacterium]
MKLTLIMAMTADGKIARHNRHFPNWTGRADKRMFKQLTTEAGVVIMGAGTFETIGKPLPGRLNVVMTRHPERFQPGENLWFTEDTPERILSTLEARGYTAAALTGGATINTLFARAHRIDDLVVTISPVLFGEGISMFSEPVNVALDLQAMREIEPGVVVLHYKFRYDAPLPPSQ